MADSFEDALRYKACQAFMAAEYDSAVQLWNDLVTLTEHPKDRGWLGLALLLVGRYADACHSFELVLKDDPDEISVLNYLALTKASCDDPQTRDGQTAVMLAARLCELSLWKNWAHVSVLAAAHAELGDWKQAEHFASLAVELAPQNEKARRHARAEQYRKYVPFRITPEIARSLLVPRDSKLFDLFK